MFISSLIWFFRLHLQGQVREGDARNHGQQETDGETARGGTGERAVSEEKRGKKGQFNPSINWCTAYIDHVDIHVCYTLLSLWLPVVLTSIAMSL